MSNSSLSHAVVEVQGNGHGQKGDPDDLDHGDESDAQDEPENPADAGEEVDPGHLGLSLNLQSGRLLVNDLQPGEVLLERVVEVVDDGALVGHEVEVL